MQLNRYLTKWKIPYYNLQERNNNQQATEGYQTSDQERTGFGGDIRRWRQQQEIQWWGHQPGGQPTAPQVKFVVCQEDRGSVGTATPGHHLISPGNNIARRFVFEKTQAEIYKLKKS